MLGQTNFRKLFGSDSVRQSVTERKKVNGARIVQYLSRSAMVWFRNKMTKGKMTKVHLTKNILVFYPVDQKVLFFAENKC